LPVDPILLNAIIAAGAFIVGALLAGGINIYRDITKNEKREKK
jgi:hypothetical protein